jgi:predicted small secreted protein
MHYPAILFAALSISLANCETIAGTGLLIESAVEAVTVASLDESDRSSLEKQSPRTLKKIDNGEQLSIDDIKKMGRAGISDDAIITQIAATKSVFYLSSADIVDLKKSGVSQRVINNMVQTGNQ